MVASFLSSGRYMVVDRINQRIISIDAVFSKIAQGYTPSVGNVIVNLAKLERGIIEKRYRLKYLGGY